MGDEASNFDFQKLPDSLMLEILTYLNHHELRNCLFVSKKWKETVTNSTATMMSFPLIISGPEWTKDNETICAIDRRFSKMRIEEFSGYKKKKKKEDYMRVFSAHGGNVRELEVWMSTFDDTSTLTEILGCFPRLEKLIFVSTIFRSESKEFQQTELKHLKQLVVIESDLELLCFVMNAQLTTLKVKGPKSYYGSDKLLFTFLARQTRLKFLALRSVISHNIEAFTSPIPVAIPKIHQLSLLNFDIDFKDTDEPVAEKFLQFLDQQSKTLKVLELGDKFDVLVYHLIIGKFDQLHTLHLHVGLSLPKEKDFYDYAGSIESVENLIIDGTPEKPSAILQEMLGCFPNVATLELRNNDFCHEMICFIATKLTKLKHLKVSKMSGFVYEKVKFESLLSLHCDELAEKFNWQAFTKKNTKLEKLSIKVLNSTIPLKDIQTIAKNLKNFKHLKLGFGMELDGDILRILRDDCANLKSFECLRCSLQSVAFPGIFFYGRCNFVRYETIDSAFRDEAVNDLWTIEAEKYYEVTNRLKRAESYDDESFREMFGANLANVDP